MTQINLIIIALLLLINPIYPGTGICHLQDNPVRFEAAKTSFKKKHLTSDLKKSHPKKKKAQSPRTLIFGKELSGTFNPAHFPLIKFPLLYKINYQSLADKLTRNNSPPNKA